MIMTQLTLDQAVAGEAAPVTTTQQKTTNPPCCYLPRFEVGALAFYRGLDTLVLPCQITRIIPTGGGFHYSVRTDTGLNIDLPSPKILSGWEDDFPLHYLIDFGRFQLVELGSYFSSLYYGHCDIDGSNNDDWDYEAEIEDLYTHDLD